MTSSFQSRAHIDANGYFTELYCLHLSGYGHGYGHGYGPNIVQFLVFPFHVQSQCSKHTHINTVSALLSGLGSFGVNLLPYS
jgi:hypothetical protein